MSNKLQLKKLLSECVRAANSYIVSVSKDGQYNAEANEQRMNFEKAERDYAIGLSDQQKRVDGEDVSNIPL